MRYLTVLLAVASLSLYVGVAGADGYSHNHKHFKKHHYHGPGYHGHHYHGSPRYSKDYRHYHGRRLHKLYRGHKLHRGYKSHRHYHGHVSSVLRPSVAIGHHSRDWSVWVRF